MLSLLLSIIFSFLSIQAYWKKQYGAMLFFLSVNAFDFMGFGKILGESPIKITDVTLLAICYIWCSCCLKHKKNFFSTKDNSLSKVLLYLFIYITIIFIGTIFLHQDTFTFALKVYRVYLALPFYFVLRRMPLSEYEKYFKYMIYASLLQGVFYYLQFIGITGILSGYGADSTEKDARLGNYPGYADIFFLYFLFKRNISLWQKIPFLIFWGMMPILGQMRGQTMVIAMSICIYLLFKRSYKNFAYLIAGCIIWILLVNPMFAKRDKGSSMSTNDEIALIFDNPLELYESYATNGNKGNFVFRLAMLSERVLYMIEHPKYALTGVGCVHELSPNNTYTMLLGTDLGEELSEDGISRPAYLSSGDNTWVGVLMRYGIIGVILFGSYYILLIKQGLPLVSRTKYLLAIVYGCYSIPNLLGTFDYNSTEQLDGILRIASIAAFLAIYRRKEKRMLKLRRAKKHSQKLEAVQNNESNTY